MSLELISSINTNFFQNYPALIKKIKSKKLLELEPKIDEINTVSEIVKTFIIDKKRKKFQCLRVGCLRDLQVLEKSLVGNRLNIFQNIPKRRKGCWQPKRLRIHCGIHHLRMLNAIPFPRPNINTQPFANTKHPFWR